MTNDLQRSLDALDTLGHVLNYLSLRWYEDEHGKLEIRDRWYHHAMLLVEDKLAEVAHDVTR